MLTKGRAIYREVVGWKTKNVAMADYHGGKFCIIRDPAGAVCALWQTG